ncbi:MAG: glycoside hydrolase domain-containing protein [Thermoguttaceae bacterium]|jgi:hypothetical protein
MRTRFALWIFYVGLAAAGLSFGAEPGEFASQLCRDGGGDWDRVVPVVVKNETKNDYTERVLYVPIAGTEDAPVEGALPLADQLAQSLRVTNSEGVEYIFNVATPDGRFVDKGPIPEKSCLAMPANVPAGSEETLYVFAGNAQAYPNPDRLAEFYKTATNLSFEEGDGLEPDAWRFKETDDGHRLLWTTEDPFSGAKCVRCDVDKGQKPSWVAARQSGIAVEPGATYRFEGMVRGKDVEGNSGWYLHLGNRENSMLSSPMLYVDKRGDFDWTRVSLDFTMPENGELLEFGTVLYGTGTAWFDDASLTRLNDDGTPAVSDELGATRGVTVGKTIRLPEMKSFRPSATNLIPNGRRYATIRVDASSSGNRLVSFDPSAIEARWNRTIAADDLVVVDAQNRLIDVQIFNGLAFFTADLVGSAHNDFWVVEKKLTTTASSSATGANRKIANQAFPGTMLQAVDADQGNDSDALTPPKFALERNLLYDGDFEFVDPETLKEDPPAPDAMGWTRDADEPGVKYEIFDSGIPELGKRSLRVTVSEDAPLKWRGWRRRVRVQPNQSYLIGYVVSTDSSSGVYDLHIHWLQEDGALAKAGMGSLANPVGGKTDWALKFGVLRSSADAAFIDLHLTNQTYGISQYDSVFIAPVDSAKVVAFGGGKAGVFQVPAVAKVFHDSAFNAATPEVSADSPAFCALALDEEETLQLALRTDALKDDPRVVSVSAPTLRGDSDVALPAPEVFVVSNTLVDYPTNYYRDDGLATERKFPTGTPGCDGWIGMWPDPLIPVETAAPDVQKSAALAKSLGDPALWNDSQACSVDGLRGVLTLRPNETRALWLRFKTSPETTPGIYEGRLTLTGSKKVEIPYRVQVLGFKAPQTKVAGVYDARIFYDYFGADSYYDKMTRISEHLLDRKLSPDKPFVEPDIRYNKETGVATADWTDYDAVTFRYFDELGGKVAYFPNAFYLFGWGVPPKVVEGEAPYPGEWPYDGADRAALRPEYKRAYQAKLKLFWEHLKEKGWADKCVLYISDEPFYSNPEIITQMKALCDMIHEVDPAIPIYSSTWVYVPEWLRYIDVWGVGHYGGVSEEALKTIKDAGGRIWWTTDGQMCLDTPLCAVERLLPYTCVAHGAEVYEFWGATWYTCDPYESASHLYISQSDQPGVRYYVRYPNGDGYIFYPGELIGRPGEIIDSIRSEQAREGIEDAGWLVGLQKAIEEKTVEGSPERAEAQKALDRALNYLPLACGSGRYSTRYIADPEEFEQIRLDVGLELEKLLKR